MRMSQHQQQQQQQHKILVPKVKHHCLMTKHMKKSSSSRHSSSKLHHNRNLFQISYITKDVLVDRILNAHLPTIIIDARDDDVIGGMIQGALFCPEANFSKKKMMCLLEKAKEKRQKHKTGIITDQKTWVVFYCMETVKRSVRCARRFYNLVMESGNKNSIAVKLLTGGADCWIRSYWNDKRLVEGYDDQYWGFEEDQNKKQQEQELQSQQQLQKQQQDQEKQQQEQQLNSSPQKLTQPTLRTQHYEEVKLECQHTKKILS